MKGFSNRWKDFPDYIIGITKEIWEERGIGTLTHYYAPDIPVRTPMGVSRGNKAVIASTMATVNEFPDRELLGEDVIWSGDDAVGYLSSHRIITKATHLQDGQFGPATGRHWQAYVIADCAAKEDTIYDEWLVRDYGGIVRQLGMAPRDYAADLIAKEGGAQKANRPFTPDADVDGGYHGTGNDNAWGQRYADTLTRTMDHDFAHIRDSYDRAVIGEYAGATRALGWDGVLAFWIGLRSSFPHAEFKIHHQIGMDADMMPPRAAIRWSLDGTHDGWGAFGEPTGAEVHVMGMAHAEFGPYGPDGIGLRREWALYDEVAIWKQILMQGT
ncbi:ester cyclase [Cognatiyoonia sp. IB215182]|uniref:ester cyclase n=1 Tax=Cognatiyoonia sp. IB215182 TaxID=3097353 RepID=UPI002A0FC8AA|nr:ester cyclase [Cognatiyoonia sp. IB215182]MDX8351451.1 ester cyclase [Cognatiyoonia sp. IB215182]